MVSPQKRKRSLSDDPNPSTSSGPAPEPMKSTDFYFDDGNIVLIAENVAFRIYKGLLARHSAVFRDMFSVVNQPANGETFDGCPTVRLSDTSRDITMLLGALNDNTQFTCNSKGGLQVLTSMLHMATKYLMDPLRNTCIKALRESYPDTLAKWDRYKGPHYYSRGVVQSIDADILLPSAYYALCSRSLKELFLAKDKLPLHVFEVYCKGKEDVTTWFASFFEAHISEDGSSVDERPPCEGPGSEFCQSAWETLEGSAMIKLGDAYEIITPDPLHMLQELLEDPCTEYMCRKCHKYLKEIIREERSLVWESLPKVFGLGTWEGLRERYKDSLTSQP